MLALKGNQGTAFSEVKAFLDEAITRKETHLVTLETIDREHGRLEVRRYWQTERLDWFADREQWEGLKSAGGVEAHRTMNGKTSVERRYHLSSPGKDAQRFARAVRGHWGIENRLHWVLDVVFGVKRPARAASKANAAAPPSIWITSNSSSLLDMPQPCRSGWKVSFPIPRTLLVLALRLGVFARGRFRFSG